VLQLVVTGRVMRQLGLAVSLAVVPVVTGLGFLGLAAAPSLVLLTLVNALRSATHRAFERPSREVLFTSVDREQRYKAKSFIDTAVYRASDTVTLWLNAGLGALGLGLPGLALTAVPFAGAWLVTSLFLARRHAAESARPVPSPVLAESAAGPASHQAPAPRVS
jgi:ATP:ADP antiporter, AAA family